MRNIYFYILFICVLTDSYAKNEKKKSSGNKNVEHTREYYEKEAKRDIENLLSNVNKGKDNEEDGDDTQTINSKQTDILMDKVEKLLKKTNTERRNTDMGAGYSGKGNFRSDDQFYADDFTSGGRYYNLMKNLRLKHKDAIQSRANMHNSESKNRFLQIKNNLISSHSDSVRNRISFSDVNNPNNDIVLRSRYNQDDVNPGIYPALIISEDKYGGKQRSSEDDLRFEDLYHSDNVDKLPQRESRFDINHSHRTPRTKSVMGTSNRHLQDHLDPLNDFYNQFYFQHSKIIPTRKESDIYNNDVVHEFANKINAKTATLLRSSKVLENNRNNLEELEKNIDLKDKNKRKKAVTVLRTDVSDQVDSENIDQLDELMIYSDDEENLRTSHKSAKPDSHGSRLRRSTFTQAGYTQDPDTCKTYNENLVKLWSNLSKLFNITEKPNERALHNIAMMIQAYLEHQNNRSPPETYKVKHEGSRDKIGQVLIKIRKMLDDAEGSAENITKTIIQYLKPFYGDVEYSDCQEVNEESLGLSVDLLYKNYLENHECHGDDNDTVRTKELALRKQTVKTGKALSSDGHKHSLANNELKPEVKTILIEDKLYNEIHKEKMPRQRPANKHRRVFKQSRKHRSHPAIYRSGNPNINDSEKLKIRSKSANKKLKKGSLKSLDFGKSSCEKYATRKLIVSLRPVIERYMGLLECQLDNTLRSLDHENVSKKRYYLYASKFYDKEDSQRYKKVSTRSKSTRQNTERNKNKSRTKLSTKRHESSEETDEELDIYVPDKETSYPWVRKYSFDQVSGMNSAVTTDTDSRGSNTKKNNLDNNSEDVTTYNEYFQSPSLYDDYEGVYKTHKINSNGFPSLINPLISVNDKKNTENKSTDKNKASSDNGQANLNVRQNDYDMFYEETYPKKPNYVFNISDQPTESTTKEFPYVDMTKLRHDDHLIKSKSKTQGKSLESITEFLKRARDSSLQTPAFAVPFALDTNKGYVELTHLVKYPKVLMYRPQFIVKNTMPYDDFLKTISNFNMTNDEVRLMKIVRHLPDSSVKVLFETEDFEAPLEVRNLNENRRSGLTDPVINYALESRIKTANENTNAKFTDGDSKVFLPIYRNEVRDNDVDALVKLGRSSSGEDLSPNLDSNLNSDANSTSISEPHSLSNSSSKLDFSSLLSSAKDVGSAVGSAVGSQIISDIDTGLDTALNLSSVIKLNPSHLGSYLSKLIPSQSNFQSISNPSLTIQSHINSHSDSPTSSNSLSNAAFNSHSQLNSHSASLSNSNSGSHSLLPSIVSSNLEVENFFPPSTKSTVIQWWKMWKNIVKRKIKDIIRKMASFTDNIDDILKL